MKINKDFIIREVAGEVIVVPTGAAAADMNGLITLNDAAAFMWKQLQEDCTREALVKSVLDEYEVDEETACEDVDRFIDALCQCNMLEK